MSNVQSITQKSNHGQRAQLLLLLLPNQFGAELNGPQHAGIFSSRGIKSYFWKYVEHHHGFLFIEWISVKAGSFFLKL
jgi:hypothetical protein